MLDINIRMLCFEMHIFVHGLYACHVCSGVVCQLDLMTTADALCTPVEVSQVYRTSHFACNRMESCLPSLYRLASAVRCKCKVNNLLSLHLLDYAESHIASSLSVYRDASHLAKNPSKRPPEELSLHHAVRLAAYRYIIKV